MLFGQSKRNFTSVKHLKRPASNSGVENLDNGIMMLGDYRTSSQEMIDSTAILLQKQNGNKVQSQSTLKQISANQNNRAYQSLRQAQAKAATTASERVLGV